MCLLSTAIATLQATKTTLRVKPCNKLSRETPSQAVSATRIIKVFRLPFDEVVGMTPPFK